MVRELSSAWRRFRWSHPEWMLALAGVLAWMGLFAMSALNGAAVGTVYWHGGHHIAHWVLMSAAMMLPTVLPVARSVGLTSRWRRRARGPALFAAGYLAVWSTMGLAAITVLEVVAPRVEGRWVLATSLVVAAGWELTRWKLHFLRDCHRLRAIHPNGWRADVGCLRQGLRVGISCLGACWAIMIPMLVVAPGVEMVLMMVLFVLVAAQLFAPRPATSVRPAAALLTGLAVAVTLVNGGPQMAVDREHLHAGHLLGCRAFE
jgi:predicted metal-binding membrane protein